MFRHISPEQAGISSGKVLEFLKVLDQHNYCTHSFIMARGRDIFAEGYYAPFHKDYKHRMYSISKSFVSIAVGLAAQEGLLSLDDKFVRYFPEYINENTTELMEEMTIRDMLTMETCVDNKVDWFTSGTKDRCEVYFRMPAGRVPGTIWEYDSTGSFMLAVIVEKVTRKPFLEYLNEKFLIKAGFSKDAYCLKCPGGHSFGDSGVMCTARDLLVFARFIMDGGKINGESYMDADYLEAATARQVSNTHDGECSHDAYGYGYLIWKAPDDGFALHGMGDQYVICDRKRDFVFIINSDNQGNSPMTAHLLFHELYHEIIDNLGEPLKEDNRKWEELKAYVGNRKLLSLEAGVASEFACKLDGRTYVLEENPMQIEYVHFDISGQKGVLTYRNNQGDKQLVFGIGYNEFSEFPQQDYPDMVATVSEMGHRYKCAASACWTEEKKLRIKVQIIDKYFGNLNMEFGFKDDKVGIRMTKYAEAFLLEYQGYANGKWKKQALGKPEEKI